MSGTHLQKQWLTCVFCFPGWKPENMGKIQTWSDHIINHFWYCARICKSTATTSDEEALKVMKVMFLSFMLDIVNSPNLFIHKSNVSGDLINLP